MSQNYFQNKKVLITGAAAGIGQALAHSFVDNGASLILLDQDGPGLVKLQKELKRARVETHTIDIKDITALEKIAEKVGKVDILINNVGVGVAKNLKKTTVKDFDLVFATNLRGPFFLTQSLSKKMKKDDSILFITSIHSWKPSLDPTYDGSKAAINNWVKNFALELAREGIRVNAVAPGHVDTKSKGETRVAKDVPLGNRATTPEEIAKAALFLTDSSLSGYITGEILEVSGGLSLWDSGLEGRI